MLHQQIINELNKQPCKIEIIKTGRGYLFAFYRPEKEKIINIAETDDYTMAFHAIKLITTMINPGKFDKFTAGQKRNIELRLSGKEPEYIELTGLKQWRKDAGQPIFDKFGKKKESSK